METFANVLRLILPACRQQQNQCTLSRNLPDSHTLPHLHHFSHSFKVQLSASHFRQQPYDLTPQSRSRNVSSLDYSETFHLHSYFSVVVLCFKINL